VHNRLEADATGALRAVPTGETETLECGVVFRSVGYRVSRSPALPFDEGRGTIANENGRVGPGVYVAGWIKRGPSGVIGTNKKDAAETVELLLADLRDAPRKDPPGRGSRPAARRARRAPRHLRRLGRRSTTSSGPPAKSSAAAGEARDLGRAARRSRIRKALTRLEAMAKTEDLAAALGRRDREGNRQLPRLRRADPAPVARWLGRIKGAAALANADLGLLDRDKADRIAAAAAPHRERRARRPVPDRRVPDRLRHVVEHERERGARDARGRRRARERRREHGAELERRLSVRRAPWRRSYEIVNDLLPALDLLGTALERKQPSDFADIVKSGRTHWMDAVPVTPRPGVRRLRGTGTRRIGARAGTRCPRLGKIPLGGTAVGTGLNTHPAFAERVRAILVKETG